MNVNQKSEVRVEGDPAVDDTQESENPEFSCFNCDHVGGGLYKPHEVGTRWFLGLEASGQASYACEDCKDALFDARPVRPSPVSADYLAA